MRTGTAPALRMNWRATSSGSMLRMRSSVDRMTRETIEVTMIVAMNHDAILMPSGRS